MEPEFMEINCLKEPVIPKQKIMVIYYQIVPTSCYMQEISSTLFTEVENPKVNIPNLWAKATVPADNIFNYDIVKSLLPKNGGFTLSAIYIPDGVIEIAEKTFEYFTSLREVYLPLSIQTIGEDSFYDCSSLISVKVRNTDPNNAASAFANIKIDPFAYSWVEDSYDRLPISLTEPLSLTNLRF